jgi:thiosulfate/3-mercaptopyruvate sulfurtransferase
LKPVVDTDWLASAGDVVLCDVRWYLDGRSGADAYRAGHIPGAVFVDLGRWLAGPASAAAGRHPLPTPEVFAEGMSSIGVGDESVVAAYDDAGGMVAGRLVWMLRVLGRQAALLDGGLAAWTGPVESGWNEPRPGFGFTARPWPAGRLATADEVGDLGEGSVLVDARAGDRFRGETEPVDPRAGHIPGAVNLPFAGNLLSPGGFFRPAAELRARFEAAGIGPDADVVAYCGSGVSACHDLLALEMAGLGPGRLYPGSWSQWSSDPSRPVAT